MGSGETLIARRDLNAVWNRKTSPAEELITEGFVTREFHCQDRRVRGEGIPQSATIAPVAKFEQHPIMGRPFDRDPSLPGMVDERVDRQKPLTAETLGNFAPGTG